MRKLVIPAVAVMAACLMILRGQQPEPAVADDGEAEPFAEAAENTAKSQPRMIRVQVELIELSHEKLVELLFTDEPQSSDATPMRKRLQDLFRSREAKVLETMLANCRSGEKTTVESIEEFIYPTEYEPWELPSEVDAPDQPQGLSASDRQVLSALVAPATPTSFETRNLGSTLEVEPNLGGKDRMVDLTFSSDMVWHTGDTVWVERKDPLGNVCRISTPDIYSMRMSTKLTCLPGQASLAGVLSPKDAEGAIDTSRKVMVFVKCQVLDVK